MNYKEESEELMNERIRSFIGKLPVQPDRTGAIEVCASDGNVYRYHDEIVKTPNGERDDRQLFYKPSAGVKHIVCSTWNDITSLEYAALPDGRLFYAKFMSTGYMRFIKRMLRLNILFVFDPCCKKTERETACFAGEDGSVVYAEEDRVVRTYPDGTTTTLFRIGTGGSAERELYEYLERDKIVVFNERYRGRIDYNSFYHETGEFFAEPTHESLVQKAAVFIVNMITDRSLLYPFSSKKSSKKADREFRDFMDNGFENTGISYNGILSVINTGTQLRVVHLRQRDLLVKAVNCFLSLGITADKFPVAFFDILEYYNRYVTHSRMFDHIDAEIVSALEHLIGSDTVSIEYKRETVLDEKRFIEYLTENRESL